ncbi:molybdopterin synthase catalytic subunit isoform X2 [Chelonus insularis]|uniref:molybdopterin synthase catalytic subunit isoform X2 n=1 Tax=Chelonus insularis TaxID=460826 RepID=UPI001589DC06|nr:molybdopterin synthase catalytic subunit isoform X2 [Chelonus insularis]
MLKVLKLEYEAYEPMALKELKNICDKIREKWDVKHIAIFHRLGEVPVCESSVIIAISSAHRQESLQAVQFTIDTLKSNVPIWKKEIYDTEESAWKENKEYNEIIPKSEFPNDCQDDKNEVKLITEDHVKKQIELDPDQVQVRADSAELKRRIDSFIFRKRQQVNSVNIQEFCCHRNVNDENENSCARVDAILVRRKDSKSHVKVHRVCNLQGPQTNSISSTRETNQKALEINNPSLDERLSVAEKFLKINKPVPRDIYQRIKNIEDRLLYLESISPEYGDFCIKENPESPNHHSHNAKRVRF